MPFRRAGRIVAAGIAVVFFGVASACYLWCVGSQANLPHWLRVGYMAAFNADLAKPGKYSVSFEAHDIDPALELEIPKDLGSRTSPDKLLSGLQATCQLLDSDGKIVYSGGIPQYAPRVWPPGSGRTCLAEYGYDTTGWHQVNITIHQPAPALKDVPHRLVVMSHRRSNDAVFVIRFVGRAALFITGVVLIALVITSRRAPYSESVGERHEV